MLASSDRIERPPHHAQGFQELQQPAASEIVRGRLLSRLKILEGVVDVAVKSSPGERVNILPGRREGKSQRIRALGGQTGQPERVDGLSKLGAIGGEIHEKLPTRVDRKRRDGREIAVLHRLRDKSLRSVAGAQQSAQARIGEVEDNQPVAARGGLGRRESRSRLR